MAICINVKNKYVRILGFFFQAYLCSARNSNLTYCVEDVSFYICMTSISIQCLQFLRLWLLLLSTQCCSIKRFCVTEAKKQASKSIQHPQQCLKIKARIMN